MRTQTEETRINNIKKKTMYIKDTRLGVCPRKYFEGSWCWWEDYEKQEKVFGSRYRDKTN